MTARKVHVTLTQAETAALVRFAEEGMEAGEETYTTPSHSGHVLAFAAGSRAVRKLNEASVKAHGDGKVER